MKSKQHYVPKFNLQTMEENVNLHTKVVNVANTTTNSDPKLSSLGYDVVAPNNDFDQDDCLDGMSSLVDDSHNTFSV